MRVGLVSPYPWDVPGGVVAHIRDLAEALVRLGHDVSVLTPVDDEDVELPGYVVRAGGSVPVPYNGSIARLLFGPVSGARARRWLREGAFDVLHVHSPETFSLSLLTIMSAQGPIVATFHAYNPRSRLLALLGSPLQPQMEKVTGRIAVSDAARKTIVEHLGGDAVIIPNGVDVARFSTATPLDLAPARGGTVAFVGRVDEPRKGLAVLADAMALVAEHRPDVRLLVAGPGDTDDVHRSMPEATRHRSVLLGAVSEEDKPRVFRSADVFVAPNIGGESFGIILLEAMAAGTPIVASDLESFRRVLDDGRIGRLVPVGDPVPLAASLVGLLTDEEAREGFRQAGRQAVRRYDWPVVAEQVVHVYETVVGPGMGVRPAASDAPVADVPVFERARRIIRRAR